MSGRGARILLAATLACECHLSAEETIEFTSRGKSQPSIILPKPKDKDTIRVVSYDNQVLVEIVIEAEGMTIPFRLRPESMIELNGGSLPWLYKDVSIPSRIDLSGKLVLLIGSQRRKDALRKLIEGNQAIRAEFILRAAQQGASSKKLSLGVAAIPIPVLRDWLKKDWLRSPY